MNDGKNSKRIAQCCFHRILKKMCSTAVNIKLKITPNAENPPL